jgi:hypothetical protein
MSHPKFDPSASPEISAIVRSAVIVATLAFFTGAMMNAVLGHRDIAVVLALAAPLGVSAWGFVRAGHNEAALGLLCCVLVTVITLILVLNPLGVHDMAVTAYAGVVCFGAMLFNRRAFVALAGLALFAATAAFLYDLGGYSRSVVAAYSSWPQYLDFLLIVVAFGFLGRIVAEKLYGSLGEAHVAAGSDVVTGLVNRAGFIIAAGAAPARRTGSRRERHPGPRGPRRLPAHEHRVGPRRRRRGAPGGCGPAEQGVLGRPGGAYR